ncbi:hypothetical protein PC128_g21049 [Phytophthora cactorum]|nr:hypothetical protein PC120_g21477 [Phytophthora cactorum]KAG3160593.1 hypothetical protein PC128_g21049 [Phytophthora cactorum]KAG4048477.1 hypothetical protein PC123_g16207 [Phytophthora cactorum]
MERSAVFAPASGIREGCPLTPLLFILAPGALYREIDRKTDLRGVVLRSAAGEIKVMIAGYADDTAAYPAFMDFIPALLRITDQFGAESGLALNHEKTMVVALSWTGGTTSANLPPPLKM